MHHLGGQAQGLFLAELSRRSGARYCRTRVPQVAEALELIDRSVS